MLNPIPLLFLDRLGEFLFKIMKKLIDAAEGLFDKVLGFLDFILQWLEKLVNFFT